MSKALDQLAKNLASGMSRRKAFWSFLGGVGAIGALGSSKALAHGREESCGEFCAQQAEIFLGLCIEASRSCGSGSCAEFTMISFNGGGGIGFNGSFNGGPFICVPVSR